MATELQVIHANLLPEASNITDADMILIIQSGRPKRALPSAMKGDKGDNVYMGLSDTHITWKIGMNGSWQNLIAIESLRGKQGYKPVFRKAAGTLQVKYENEDDSAYVNIFEKEELKLQFSDLTAEEVEQLKLHFSDLTEEDLATLQQPAIEAAAEVREAAIEWENEENVRKSNEAERIEAEAARDAAETSRSEAESTRQSNETARETAESTRVATEIEREANELTRKSNESTRQAQEAERQTNTATAITNAETATVSANTAAQNAIKAKEDTEAATALATELNEHPWIIRQGVWYKWNTDTDQYESTGLQAKGDTGASFTIVGIYDTIDALKAAVPDGTDVDGVYAVGTGDPYDYYAWVFYNDAWQWVNQGQLRGPEGKSAYEVWLTQGNEGKSYADYITYLQQPATEAAETANQAAEAANQAKEAADQAEALRMASETAREQAESSRQAAEIAREQAESSRQSAETAREQAESNRGEAEDLRQTNEDARIAAELARKANEDARQLQESQRSDAESTRQAQEAERQTNTATAIANAENATDAANTAAENAREATRSTEAATALANELNDHPWIIQGGVWHKWNTETDQYESTGISAKGDKGDTGTVGIMLDAEPTEDTLTYIVGDVTYNFELGMAAICQDSSADNGRRVYLFKGKTDEGKAIWWKTGSNYQHPSHTAHESGMYKITTDGLGHVSDATAVTKEDITGLGIPAQDTTYEDATTSASGLMSSSDKTKMDRLESYTTSTTVASLDVNYQTIYVTLSKNASLSASGTGSAYNGRSITAYVYTSSSVTITIPTSGDYVSMCGSSFTTTAGGWVEFSLVCVNGVWHIAKLEAE